MSESQLQETFPDLTNESTVLYTKMIQTAGPLKQAFDEEDLTKLNIPHLTTTQTIMPHVQLLLNHGLVKVLEAYSEKAGKKTISFQPIALDEALKLSKMTPDEAMVYSHISASGREGIWTKTIKAKTNLHQHVVSRCLKNLENQSFIKVIKSVKFPQRKIYMLYHLTPSIEVTGGPWFTDSELDTDFISTLLIVVWRFVAQKSYPSLKYRPEQVSLKLN
ncbi:unnamed protein product [Ambrosiozyma monospora]|uniref:Unnamed protein product n=1 Tax=Ambrosiozyma monospora TaxID=43982 RepID=A0ACB5TWM5_AMBMO|nr:unnamed protein product [Ambrosiozyma monospora]